MRHGNMFRHRAPLALQWGEWHEGSPLAVNQGIHILPFTTGKMGDSFGNKVGHKEKKKKHVKFAVVF